VINPGVFSGTFAFDLTSNNGDRHLNNYLYLRVNGEVLIMLIDFSRALNFDGWPMPPLPMPASAKTTVGAVYWSKFHPFTRAEAERIIDAWNSLPDSKMADILARMPEEWMGQSERDILIAWWSSDARRVRGEDARRNLL
jgi:hypothetical protein